MNDCIFCKIANKEIPASIVYETGKFIAFLDIRPVNLGHLLLVPKEHHKNLFDIPDSLACDIGIEMKKLAQVVKDATGADGINIGMNNERAAGQLVDHAHIHIIPRFADDGLHHWPQKEVSKEDLAKMAEKIKNRLG